MKSKLPALIVIIGFAIVLGAEGDAYCNTGRYIVARAVIGCVMMVGGWVWAKIKAARAGATARTATGKNIPFTVYTREGGASSAGRGTARSSDQAPAGRPY